MTWPDKVLIVAEISCNHCGDYATALRLIDAAAEVGADAVKFQLYKPESMTLDMDLPQFQVQSGPWAGRQLWDLYTETQTPWEWMPSLEQKAEAKGLKFILSVYDAEGLEWAEKHLDVWAYKVASFELNDIDFVRQVAKTERRTIGSIGLATDRDVLAAVDAIGRDWSRLALLHCVTAYPAQSQDMQLYYLRALAAFGPIAGLSDHSLDPMVSAMAVAAGARIIEKHFTLSRGNGSQDAAFSLESDEFEQMVRYVRHAEAVMGTGEVKPSEYRRFRRAVYAIADIREGETFTVRNVKTLRAEGLVSDLATVLGKRAGRRYTRGEAIDG